jgi:hypothetical protein
MATKILVIDIGGSNVKLMISRGEDENSNPGRN